MPDRAPLVSIGLPVYNGARYLRQALDDFLGQTFGDFELIVSDNASVDETAEIVAAYAARDPRVRAVRNEQNVGALANANRTMALARGRYFGLAAYDDRHAPDFLARLVAALEADPGAVAAYGLCEMIGEAGELFAFDAAREGFLAPNGYFFAYDRRLERPLPADPVARYRAVLGSSNVNAPVHGLFRREALARTGGHRLHGSDRLLLAHAALLGRFAFVDAPLFYYRMHGASTYHLPHAERVAREAAPGEAAAGLGWRTLLNYFRAAGTAGLRPLDRLRAIAATAGYALGRAVRNGLRPGKTSYWGWRRPAPYRSPAFGR